MKPDGSVRGRQVATIFYSEVKNNIYRWKKQFKMKFLNWQPTQQITRRVQLFLFFKTHD
jgi:hypothetical protein